MNVPIGSGLMGNEKGISFKIIQIDFSGQFFPEFSYNQQIEYSLQLF
jgi:hypothetical protein